MTPAMHSRAAGVVAEWALLEDRDRAAVHDTYPDLADAVRNLVAQWDAEVPHSTPG